MSKRNIAIDYLKFLEQGNVPQIIALFHSEGMVDSPIYGSMKASLFYPKLNNDTQNSQLKLQGIFEDFETGNLAIYFNYIWTLKNSKQVVFDVIDILEFDTQYKIKKLKIIYDTVVARSLQKQLDS